MTPSRPGSAETKMMRPLRQAGLRLTPQRLAVYRYLARVKTHPTAQQVHAALLPEHPSLSLATVYNTLDLLVGLGVIHALGPAGDDAVHYDGDTSPHVNLACQDCHRVIDLQSKHVLALRQAVAEQSGYQLLGASVLYYGVCPQCQVKRHDQS